jgi:hypothetical protein
MFWYASPTYAGVTCLFSPILEFPPRKNGYIPKFPPENLVYTRFFSGEKLVYTQFSLHWKSGMRIHILTFPPNWFFSLMNLKFYSINMHLIINFSIPYILIIQKWSFNIINKTIYAELMESLYSNRSWISFERSVTLIPGTHLTMLIRIAIGIYYRLCDVHLILIQCLLYC